LATPFVDTTTPKKKGAGANYAPNSSFHKTKASAKRQSGLSLRRKRLNRDVLSKSTLELNNPINKREQRVVTACAYVVTRMVCASTLTNEDVSSLHYFATELLNTKTLTATVSTVSGTSYRFLMSHYCT